MKQYTVTKAIMINSGEITLSPEQARRRKHLLKQVEEGVFEPKGELWFKVGEVIGLPRTNKAQMLHLEPVISMAAEEVPPGDEEVPPGDEEVPPGDEEEKPRKPGRPRK